MELEGIILKTLKDLLQLAFDLGLGTKAGNDNDCLMSEHLSSSGWKCLRPYSTKSKHSSEGKSRESWRSEKKRWGLRALDKHEQKIQTQISVSWAPIRAKKAACTVNSKISTWAPLDGSGSEAGGGHRSSPCDRSQAAASCPRSPHSPHTDSQRISPANTKLYIKNYSNIIMLLKCIWRWIFDCLMNVSRQLEDCFWRLLQEDNLKVAYYCIIKAFWQLENSFWRLLSDCWRPLKDCLK